MKTKVVSVLGFPYNNKFEVRITRAGWYNQPATKVNVYSVSYSEKEKVNRLAELAGKMVGLSLLDMVNNNVRIANPTR